MKVNDAVGVTLLVGAIILVILASISESGTVDLNQLPWQIIYIMGLLFGCLLSILGGN